MAQNVVKIAGNPFPLRDLGQVLDLFLCPQQLLLFPSALREMNIDHSYHCGQTDIHKPCDRRRVQQVQLHCKNQNDPCHCEVGSARLDLERQERCAIDKETACSAVEGDVSN